MLDNFLTVEEETWDNKDVILQKDAENNVDGAREQRGSFKANGNNQDI